ncbi:hypothetical protein BSKO_11082 [Bryopsis sp. KO-2023]|nr:hypothetical protein BSKO_11082 [Bryopsis sp. KO-2023]
MTSFLRTVHSAQSRCRPSEIAHATLFRHLASARTSPPRSRSSKMSAAAESKPVTLYTAGTPNGWKPTVVLEELSIPYNVHAIAISKNEQKEESFLKINPNGRIPAMVDHEKGDLAIFESGAIMMYLCDRFDAEGVLLPKDLAQRYEVIEWLMFQMGGVGPMQGQANHFSHFAPEKIEYGQQRYLNETKRLYGVMEKQLEGKDWLAAGKYTLADIANYCWVAWHFFLDIDIKEFPNLKGWLERIHSRDAVLRAMDVPEPWAYKPLRNDPDGQKALFKERMSK